MPRIPKILALLAALALFAASCGDDDTDAGSGDRPTVVVTTNILGDVVENLTGGAVEVVTIMPVGADPHDFQASAQQAAAMRDADVLIVNGLAFEEGLLDVIEGARVRWRPGLRGDQCRARRLSSPKAATIDDGHGDDRRSRG